MALIGNYMVNLGTVELDFSSVTEGADFVGLGS